MLTQTDLWDYDDDEEELEDEWKVPSQADSEEEGGKRKRGPAQGQPPAKKSVLQPLLNPLPLPQEISLLDDSEEGDDDDVQLMATVTRANSSKEASVSGVSKTQGPGAAGKQQPAAKGKPPPAKQDALNEQTRQTLAREHDLMQRLKRAVEVDTDESPRDDPPLLQPQRYVPRYQSALGMGAKPNALSASTVPPPAPRDSAAAPQPGAASAPQPSSAVAAASAAPAAEEDKVVLKCMWAVGKDGVVSLRIGRSDPLSKLMDAFRKYAVSRDLTSDPSKIRFRFEGEALDASATPDDLDLDDDDLIDIKLP